MSVSGYLEEIIANRLDSANVPVPERVDVPVRTRRSPASEDIISQHFTF